MPLSMHIGLVMDVAMMNKLQKDAIYDELCNVLTIYESDDDLTATDCMEILYEMLVKIQNNWEELTGGMIDGL